MKKRMRTWTVRIAAARKRGKFTPGDLEAAARWTTCAVGEATGYPETAPQVLSLARGILGGALNLGIDFCHAVQADDIVGAARLLKQIRTKVEAIARG